MEGKEKKRSRARGGRAEEYLDALCRQIHWKSYRKAIRDELKDHIEDASSEMRKKGLSADQALEKALCDLGDPAETGRKLNRIYRPSWNKRLAAAVLGGTALFQVLYLSAGVQSGVLDGAGLRMRLLETVIWLLAGVLLSAVVFSRDYSRTAVVRKWLLILCLATVLGAAAVRQVFRGQGESMVTGLMLLLLCRGAVKVFRSQKSFTGRLLTAALLTGWILRAGLAVLTNLGLPLAPGAVLPFLDGHCAMAVFYFQMGILETVSCFGNYVKGERGDGDKSRLLDIRDGKIIITYR